jgi:hypothetical protein
MRRALILAASALLIAAPMMARADLAPPPDTSTGPASAHVAGLSFERKRIRHIGPASAPENRRHPLGYGTYVFLADCDASSENCSRAQQADALGAAVTKVDGVEIGDNVQALQDALGSGDHTLTLVAASDVIVQPDDPKEISLAVSVP